MKRKLISLSIALIMLLFTVIGFSGCSSRVECICDEVDCFGVCNFELTVEVESYVINSIYDNWLQIYVADEEEFVIIATLANVGGRRTTIARRDSSRCAILFSIHIPSGKGIISGSVPLPPIFGWSWVSANLDDGEYISGQPRKSSFGFAIGKHEATVTAGFYINHRSRNNRQFIRLEYTFTFEVV
ncbi:MAG: hypothetical protein FWE03_07485 [Firmicutes bacterium]|nr:hypothetical protein [Bacillota bacterium]